MDELLAAAPMEDSVAFLFITIRLRFGSVPHEIVRHFVQRSTSDVIWSFYGAVEPETAEWVLLRRPDLLIPIVRHMLSGGSAVTMTWILDRAAKDRRDPGVHPDHPLCIIQDLVREENGSVGFLTYKRHFLLKALCEWHQSGTADAGTSLHVMAIVFSPAFTNQEAQPINLTVMTNRFGGFLSEEIAALPDLWAEAVPLLRACGLVEWSVIRDMIRSWAYPFISSQGGAIPGVYQYMYDFALRMMRDVLAVAEDYPEIRSWISDLAAQGRARRAGTIPRFVRT